MTLIPTTCLAINVALLGFVASRLTSSQEEESSKYHFSSLRLIISTLLTTLLAAHGYRRKSVSFSGMISGAFIAFFMFLTHSTIALSLLITFFTTTKATRYRDDLKCRFEANFKAGGQRNWLQIICNLGVASIATLLLLITTGADSELEIDFAHHYRNSWLLLSALGALSCALGDTLSSELGPVLAEEVQPVLITTMRTVPKGTNGGITIAGLFAACLGGTLIGLGSWIFQSIIPTSSAPTTTHWSSPQWPIVFFCLYAGLFGSLLDSLLGATCQYTGFDHFRKRITEVPPSSDNPGTFVEHISGRPILDNHDVNLVSILVMAVATPCLAAWFWPGGVPF